MDLLTVVEATVGQDLSICLYDTKAQKIVKSLPKKGADADKHAAASAELSDLKKNLKKVVKSRNDILFERFLDGRTQKATAWIGSYTKNPVLRRVAELIVWNQKHDYLIPEEVTAIKGKDFVPFAMNKFQITTNVKKIDWKAFGKCACIKKFVVVDATTKKVIFRKKFEINQGSCQNPNITLLPEFREFVKGYPKNLTK